MSFWKPQVAVLGLHVKIPSKRNGELFGCRNAKLPQAWATPPVLRRASPRHARTGGPIHQRSHRALMVQPMRMPAARQWSPRLAIEVCLQDRLLPDVRRLSHRRVCSFRVYPPKYHMHAAACVWRPTNWCSACGSHGRTQHMGRSTMLLVVHAGPCLRA